MKRGTLWDSLTYCLLQNIKKIRSGDSSETLKIFEKKIAQCRKEIERGGPFGVFRFCRLRKKGKKRKGGPFAVSLHWSNLA